MVIEFLQSLQETFTSQKFDKQEELDFVGTKIRETEKFIHLLESENEQPFSDFTPRVINSKSQERLNELNQSLSDLLSQRTQISSEIDHLNHWLGEIEQPLLEVRTNSNDSAKPLLAYSKPETPSGKGEVVKRLNEINHLLPVDPMRAKLEITKLISKISG